MAGGKFDAPRITAIFSTSPSPSIASFISSDSDSGICLQSTMPPGRDHLPFISSPLHQTFQPYGVEVAARTATTTGINETVSTENVPSFHDRAMSRSSSVPNKIEYHYHAGPKCPTGTEHTVIQASQPLSPDRQSSTRNSQSSVRHLTCFWWKEKGFCRFTDEDCLYAHYDTGHYTDPPRQIIPGEPALAGRKLDRAVRNLASVNKSTAPINAIPVSRRSSRPSTPGFEYNSPIEPSMQVYAADHDVLTLSSDNKFLRNIVDQNGKEKAVMISHIESLQADNKSIKAELEGLRKAQEQLLTEREGLHGRIHQLEQHANNIRSVSAPYGTIGRARMTTEARYLGGLLDNE